MRDALRQLLFSLFSLGASGIGWLIAHEPERTVRILTFRLDTAPKILAVQPDSLSRSSTKGVGWAVTHALNPTSIYPSKLRHKDVREAHFLRMPRFAARFYDWFLSMKPTQAQTCDVACDLVTRIKQGRLLDIGTGPGRLLLEVHRLNPRIELFGLDISPAMIEVAKENLNGISVDLRQGRAEQTGLPADFFDLVTCTGSLYLWDYPEEGLEEIFRILKRGCSAYLFEVYKDVNEGAFRDALRSHLRELDIVRRLIGPFALRKALRIAARMDEYVAIIENTSFAESYAVDKIELGGLPMWLRMTLDKRA